MTTLSLPRTPTAVVPRFTASMAYSTWNLLERSQRKIAYKSATGVRLERLDAPRGVGKGARSPVFASSTARSEPRALAICASREKDLQVPVGGEHRDRSVILRGHLLLSSSSVLSSLSLPALVLSRGSHHSSNGMGGGAVALLRKLLKWGPQLELRRRIGFYMVVCGRIGNGKDRLKSENNGHLLRPRVAPTSGPQAISPRLARGRPSPLPHPARAPSTCPPLLQKFQSELALRVPRERQVGPQPLYDLFHRQILWQRPFDHLAGG